MKTPPPIKADANPGPHKETQVTDGMKGGGAATTEIDELRARVIKLEGEKNAEPPSQSGRRMVPLGAGFCDQFGRPVMVPAQRESLGDRLVRNEFAEIGREEFLRDEAVQAIGKEVAGDAALHQRIPEPSPTPTLQRKQIDTRTGLDSLGPSQDAKTLNHVDRIAAGFDKLDKAEALKRHREAFEEK